MRGICRTCSPSAWADSALVHGPACSEISRGKNSLVQRATGLEGNRQVVITSVSLRLSVRAIVFASAFCCILISGCRDNVSAVGDRLVSELLRDYPSEIDAIHFENQPPLDPPTLWIDLAPSMQVAEQRRFVCEVILPKVTEANSAITTVTTVGIANEICA